MISVDRWAAMAAALVGESLASALHGQLAPHITAVLVHEMPIGLDDEDRTETAALLSLIHEAEECGVRVSSATSGRGAASAVFAKAPGFPQGMSSADVFDRLRDAERSGLIARQACRDPGRKPCARWVLTSASCDAIGVAPGGPL